MQFIELNEDPIDRFPDSRIYKQLETISGEDYKLKVSYAGRPGFDASVNLDPHRWRQPRLLG